MTVPAQLEIRNPGFSLKRVKALVFDLDDTLYAIPSGSQFFRYGEHLGSHLPEKERKVFLRELESAWRNGSPFKVGRAFDEETEWILQFNDHWKIKKAYCVDGNLVPHAEVRAKYNPNITVDELPHLIHFASGWGIPSALGHLHKLGGKEFRAAYVATRKDMRDNPEAFPLIVPSGFAQFFQKLQETGYPLIIITNSDLSDAEEILKKLQIHSCIHQVYAQARKPKYSQPVFEEILTGFDVNASDLLVIGDSVYNDLRYSKKIGAQTVLIELFPNQPLGIVDVLARDFRSFMELWKQK